MRFGKYLDDLTRIKNFQTAKELADWLGVTPPAVSQYKSNVRSPENEICIKIAMEINVDPMEVIMAADLDRAERAGQHSAWEIFLERTKAAAASVLVFLVAALSANVTNFVTPTTAQAETMRVSELPIDNNINYANWRHYFRLAAVTVWTSLKRLLIGAAFEPATP